MKSVLLAGLIALGASSALASEGARCEQSFESGEAVILFHHGDLFATCAAVPTVYMTPEQGLEIVKGMSEKAAQAVCGEEGSAIPEGRPTIQSPYPHHSVTMIQKYRCWKSNY